MKRTQAFTSRNAGKKINFSYLSKEYFYTEHISKVFPWMGCDHPTYLALTYLFDQIPSDRFIVVGGGDLDRSQAIYQVIKKEYSIDAKGLNLPFSSSRMAYYLWARQNKRAGEFYFFSSTPELIASVLTDPDFILASDGSQVRSMMQKAFPEIPSRHKSTNWDNEAYRENIWVRSRVDRVARELEGMHFWRSGIGTMVNMDKIFYDRE